MSVEEYERSWEQNEELGLNDMDTSSADNAYSTNNKQWIFCELIIYVVLCVLQPKLIPL